MKEEKITVSKNNATYTCSLHDFYCRSDYNESNPIRHIQIKEKEEVLITLPAPGFLKKELSQDDFRELAFFAVNLLDVGKEVTAKQIRKVLFLE